eukprot:TRINITY_DN6747_c0_g2_i1.p1 TRINITY_DN6747_c0_g2~~TRINITY_DN6747_c0_g2_i1.p1  ORF type:complete len:407 (-),score=56.15 TRINITY_DN6747_c0_g2_i1:160-1380(-)
MPPASRGDLASDGPPVAAVIRGMFHSVAGCSFLCGIHEEEEKRRRDGGIACVEFVAEDQAPTVYSREGEAGVRVYSTEAHQPLLGVPLREGSLWHLSAQDCFEPVNFNLYVNGIAFAMPNGLEASVSLSPFALVRNCRFQAGECSKLKSFKVSLLEQDMCCYFAVQSVCERQAEEERSSWVLCISHTILLITSSLMPQVPMTCDPVRYAKHTRRRLLAGYLVHRDDQKSLSVVYCELNAHDQAEARMIIYEDHTCRNQVWDIYITESSVCCDIVGINCSCFVVDYHNFAAQTPSERKLWLRALSNVKVKMQNRAPPPTDEELEHYRQSIREHLRANEAFTSEPRLAPQDPLLAPTSQRRQVVERSPLPPRRVFPGTSASIGNSSDGATKEARRVASADARNTVLSL